MGRHSIRSPIEPQRPELGPPPPRLAPRQHHIPAPRHPAAATVAEPTQRLIAGWVATGRPADLDEHLRRYGSLPFGEFDGRHGARRLIELTERAGLRGRGGAGFPTARKMISVSSATTSRRTAVVVANGCEGDPTSGKDNLLLHSAPHLVLDGLALAAHAVGADQAILCLHRGSTLVEPLADAIAQRPDDPAETHVVTTPRRYVSSEAAALVNFLTTGDARPTSKPPRSSECGVQGRPTLVDNVETLAHRALIARYGADWFRSRGTADSPGTMLVTVGVAVHRPGVYEVDVGARAGYLLRLAGGATELVQAMLLGGLGGQLAGATGRRQPGAGARGVQGGWKRARDRVGGRTAGHRVRGVGHRSNPAVPGGGVGRPMRSLHVRVARRRGGPRRRCRRLGRPLSAGPAAPQARGDPGPPARTRTDRCGWRPARCRYSPPTSMPTCAAGPALARTPRRRWCCVICRHRAEAGDEQVRTGKAAGRPDRLPRPWAV